MGITISSGSMGGYAPSTNQVTVSGLTKHTVSHIYSARTTAGTTTIATVPAGKKWSLLLIAVSGSSAYSGDCNIYVQRDSGADYYMYFTLKASATITAVNGSQVYNFPYSDSFMATAGQVIQLTTTQTATVNCDIYYVEEAV